MASPAAEAAVAAPARRQGPSVEDPAARKAKREPEERPRRATPGRIEQPEIVERIAPKVEQGEEPREEKEAAPAREVVMERVVEREREKQEEEEARAPWEEVPEPAEANEAARAPERETRERTAEVTREREVEREVTRRERTERVVERWLFGEREDEREERMEPGAVFRKPQAPATEPEAKREREETRVEIGRVEVRMSAPEKKRGPAAPKPAAGTLSRGATMHHGLRQS